MDTSGDEGASKVKKEEKKKERISKIDRKDDIPDCPSLEDVTYYDNGVPKEALKSPSQLTVSEEPLRKKTKSAKIALVKEAISKQVYERQREKELEELYGMVDESSSDSETEDTERVAAIRELNEPWRNVSVIASNSVDTQEEKEARKRIEERRKQTEEMINQAVWASFTMVKQSAFLFGKMIKYSSQYPTPIGIILILTGLYFIVMYLELSAAAFVEWLIQWFWPTTRLILRTSEKILKQVAGFLSEMDVLGQSTYCDMADLWCTEFGLMCHRKCSFLDMALDRSRF